MSGLRSSKLYSSVVRSSFILWFFLSDVLGWRPALFRVYLYYAAKHRSGYFFFLCGVEESIGPSRKYLDHGSDTRK